MTVFPLHYLVRINTFEYHFTAFRQIYFMSLSVQNIWTIIHHT